MRTYLIITFSLLTLTVTIAQKKSSATRQETVDWISEKIRQYSYQSSEGTVVIHVYNITSKGDSLLIENNMTFVSSLGQQIETHSITSLPINLIKSINFIEKPSTYWLTINMKDVANVVVTRFDGRSPESSSSTNIILSKTLDSENLRERIFKAFDHLIQLHAGKVQKEPF